jgi:hypothetical protein
MSKKLRLTGYWLFVHALHMRVLRTGVILADNGMQYAIEKADVMWLVMKV